MSNTYTRMVKKTVKVQLAFVATVVTAILFTACTDQYRNPADDPANKPQVTEVP